MTEQQARQVLLLKAAEQAIGHAADGADAAAAGDPTRHAGSMPAWTATDSAWASAEARRILGEPALAAQASGQAALAFLRQRAQLGLRRLAQRDGVWADGAPQALTWRPWLAAGGLLLALLAGVAGDSLSADHRINLLAPPLLALLLWNLLVYAVLLLAALRRVLGRRRSGTSSPPPHPVSKALLALATRLARPLRPRSGRGWHATAYRGFTADWLQLSRPVLLHQAAAWLHAAAALLALGAVLAMYGRGLAFDYRAGWDSTFLAPAQVHAWLSLLLGPAAALSGQSLPDVSGIAALRWAAGSTGEGAARWIHWHALTMTGVVVLPRVVLAAVALWRARRAAAALQLPLTAPYFRQLLQQAPATAWAVTVLPYSYQLGPAQRSGLAAALSAALEPGALPELATSLPLGAEDNLPTALPTDLAERVVALFALTATPERETHGAFVTALVKALPARCRLQVVVDESVFRQRLGPSIDALVRLQQRQQAWSRLLHDLSLPAPVFADLASGAEQPKTAAVAG